MQVDILGRSMRINSTVDEATLSRSTALLEQTFRDMERAYELRWGCPPSALDTSTWMLMGALNLAHQIVRLEQAASQQTQDLELTLTKLLDDVPDETLPPGALFEGQDPS
ncbi:MAG TPA: cell division protein ZapA [Holophaga sp.]|nr:cell division protein ZapA [Holophaga sp.]HPS68206.1 cell division protein ZapA [Holophaga sp.]